MEVHRSVLSGGKSTPNKVITTLSLLMSLLRSTHEPPSNP